eukprot:CAMPEP_0113934472 /NCGR_PEP_ID=MMETSP1339-20121228/1799_1 /TAXON_ID=94617 /ORGANISM="Fibrocapsa japonica" /LENGTH=89 /DNA_ID=CAMNT_0000936291 /DNA_START=730 /DNA_END=999 /DNA_ORIENTATION=- /assembly_acc=CAM_ASM_000762
MIITLVCSLAFLARAVVVVGVVGLLGGPLEGALDSLSPWWYMSLANWGPHLVPCAAVLWLMRKPGDGRPSYGYGATSEESSLANGISLT